MMNEIELIIAAQEAQLANPTRACVNSESGFVRQRLYAQGHHDLAARYWNFVCLPGDKNKFGEKVAENERRLREIDNEFQMPSWGTRGT